jgi:hypothetical protein
MSAGDTLRRIGRKLRREARQAATMRGHTLARFSRHSGWGIGSAYEAACGDCTRGVWIEETPPPHGINMAGEAFAVSCTGRAS